MYVSLLYVSLTYVYSIIKIKSHKWWTICLKLLIKCGEGKGGLGEF